MIPWHAMAGSHLASVPGFSTGCPEQVKEVEPPHTLSRHNPFLGYVTQKAQRSAEGLPYIGIPQSPVPVAQTSPETHWGYSVGTHGLWGQIGHTLPPQSGHEPHRPWITPPDVWSSAVTNDKPLLGIEDLWSEAAVFSRILTETPIEDLYGTTDGKAIGTYVEHEFRRYLRDRYEYEEGSAASGIDFPGLDVDLKVTSITQPQSSSPLRDASQKVYGLGYSLLVLVYAKEDDNDASAARLEILNAIYIDASRTADHQTTTGITGILERDGNADDLVAFFEERNLPLDDIGRAQLAERVLADPPVAGYLTISNALQWRLQYRRAITLATDMPDGLKDLLT